MKNLKKTLQVLEDCIFQPLSIKFISLKDRGNLPTYYQKLSTQSIQQQQQQKQIKIGRKIKFYIPFRYTKIRNASHFLK